MAATTSTAARPTDLLRNAIAPFLPGTIVETPGWVRISLTASDQMVERGIPGFAAAMREAHEL